MLAGPGLGDDPPLAHAAGQQRLANGVVDLVRASMVEILALEQHRGSDQLREARRRAEEGRATDELLQQEIVLRPEGGILAGRVVQHGEFLQRRHQRLGHVASAVDTEAPVDRALGRQRDCHASTSRKRAILW
jgi:hypothetical protein